MYLDIVDAYWYWGSDEATTAGEASPYSSGDGSANELTRCADDMVDFISALAAHARATDADFIVCPQNATDIIHDMSSAKLTTWWATIDAVGAEDAYYYGDADMDNAWNPQTEVLANLDDFVDAGKSVYCIEYVSASRGSAIDKFFEAASARGFAYYCADRPLDTLR